MSKNRKAAIQFFQKNRARFIEEFVDIIAIPSISTESEHKNDMQRCADWLAQKLDDLGMDNASVYPTSGEPIVYGESLTAGRDAPTVLIYGHYDVQPVDPVELWDSDPFSADIRGDNLYARGATDMKGQLMASLFALEAIKENGGLPVNVKFLFEGEEEIGSPSLDGFIADHRELLTCDLVLNPDTGMLAPDLPTITYALRGLVYFELRIYGPEHDLHSGMFGGVVNNPAQVLCELVAGMHDEQGKITLPGFYNNVRSIDDGERRELARLPLDEAFYLKQSGVPSLWGESEFSPVERVGARPTLEVNGLLSGFTGEGSKTVLPSSAMAKISCRLVPDQEPEEVHQQMLAYLSANAPNTVRYELELISVGSTAISDRESTGVKAMSEALNTVWGKRPVFRREGGTIPVVAMFKDYLDVESVNTGFSLPDDNLHAPNEKIHLPTWERGIEAIIHFFYNL